MLAVKQTFEIAAWHQRFAERTLRNIGPAGLVRLDVGPPDHLAPLLGFLGDQLAEVGGRARKRPASQVGKPSLHLGIGERGVGFLVELIDDVGRCVPGRTETLPRARLVTGHKLAHR